ncbi:uncharacterized protein [Channa argus]|uniref:uncharacterized protein isoform X2 n=1 Tax=Channa argus TaxID=215402 RepID=UPI0029478E59|nr:hypothetical protein Q8A73_008415 [Channa argus]
MSTDRPKRNIIKKQYDISDGMPWCEEHLVRKVLLLSLREFRDTHRATHKLSVKHTRAHKHTSKNTILHAPQKAQNLSNKHTQKNTRTTQRVHTAQQKPPNTHTLKNTHSAKKLRISKHMHCHEHTNKGQKATLSQDSHISLNKYTPTQNMQTQSKMCAGKMPHSVQHTHLQENKNTFQKNSVSTRTLRSHKTQLQNTKYTESDKHTHSTHHHQHSVRSSCNPDNTQKLLNTPSPARTLRSHTPTSLNGSVVNGSSRCQSLKPAGPSWSWSLQARPQQHRPLSIYAIKDDPTSKRPRLQAQRKFAQSPPSSPGPPIVMTSARSDHSHNLPVVSCLTRRRPKTEDFLSFLCLRGSTALPSNMAFLPSGREKDPSDRHPTTCLSTNHRTAEGRKMSMFRRTTVQRDSRSLGRRSGDPFCPLTARIETRREREKREEEQQRRREDRRERVKGQLLRPRQLSLQVPMATRLTQQQTSCVRPVPLLKPSTGVGSRRSLRSRTRPSNTCNPRGHPQSRTQESKKKHLSWHSNHQLPRNQHLSLHHQTVSNYYSNPETFSSLQNSGRNLSRTPTQIPLTTGSIVRQLSENPGVLRLSRRRRGLPPDTSPATLDRVPLNNNSSKKCRTLQYNSGDVSLENHCHIGKTPQKDGSCDKDVREDPVSHMGNTSAGHEYGCGRVGEREMLERDSCISEDLQGELNVEKSCLTSVTTLEPPNNRVTLTSTIKKYELSPASEGICRQVREKRFQRNQPTIPKTVTRTTESRTVLRGATARTTITKEKNISVTSTYVHTEPPASHSAKHTAKGTNKDINKCTSPTSTYTICNSQGAGKDSLQGTTEDLKDSASVSSYSSTSKGSAKGLTHTKSATSATKTRTSPRILMKC